MLLRAGFFCHDRMEMFCERASCQAIGGSMHALSCIIVHAWWCLFLRWGGVHYLVIAGALIGVACLFFCRDRWAMFWVRVRANELCWDFAVRRVILHSKAVRSQLDLCLTHKNLKTCLQQFTWCNFLL